MSSREEAAVQVHVHHDTHILLDGELIARIEASARDDLARFDDHVTRVEVHLTDQSGGKRTGRDVRCVMTADATGLSPVVVTETAETVAEAIAGATETLQAALGKTFERIEDRGARETIRGH